MLKPTCEWRTIEHTANLKGGGLKNSSSEKVKNIMLACTDQACARVGLIFREWSSGVIFRDNPCEHQINSPHKTNHTSKPLCSRTQFTCIHYLQIYKFQVLHKQIIARLNKWREPCTTPSLFCTFNKSYDIIQFRATMKQNDMWFQFCIKLHKGWSFKPIWKTINIPPKLDLDGLPVNRFQV